MGVPSGTRLGAYEILSPLGVGGMGEVYRARDTTLNRDVAIKVLPEAFQIDPSRVARFAREAQVLAALNHPNIAAIYGVEDSHGVRALVLELVEGPTLADRIRQGPIPTDEALQIAGQLAVALAAAHDAGVIHRDLKPSNIKVRDDGATKVLDFGLAKLVDPDVGSEIDPAEATASPTVTSPAILTGVGLILGTAAYMSPEQAKGRPADKRSDIWAFGCVLYEMLAGKRAFEGEDVNDTLAAVLRSQPDLSALPADLPAPVRLAVSGCLEKDRNKRFSDMAIVQFLLTTQALAAGSARPIESTVRSRWRRVAALLGAAAVGAAVVGVALTYMRAPAPALPVTRFTFRLPEGQHFTNPGRLVVAFSPDGSRVAYVANQGLYVKTMWNHDPVQLVGPGLTPGLNVVTSPVFSPDSRWIAYWSDRAVFKVAVTGGMPVKLCEADNPIGMSWTGGRLLMGSSKGVLGVPDSGGTVEVVLAVKENETADGPQLLPDGRSILFSVAIGEDRDRWDTAEIAVQTIGSTERRTIIRGGADARYTPNGYLVYAVGGALFCVRFNVRTLETVGPSTPVVSGVARATALQTGIAQFSFSSTGSLAYLPGPAEPAGGGMLELLDRKGNVQPLKFPAKQFQAPRFCPTNGQQLAVGIDDGSAASIWMYDLSGGNAPRQLTIGGKNRFPAWTRDGTRIAFQSESEGDEAIFWQPADGSKPAERLTRPEKGQSHIPEGWSPDGDTLLFSSRIGREFVLQQLTLHDRRVTSVAGVTSTQEPQSGFSPDGRWIVYAVVTAARNGTGGLFVRPFPLTNVEYRIGPGVGPFWSSVGTSLYFVPAPGFDSFSFVNIATEPTFEVSEPSTVPRPAITGGGPGLPRAYDVAPDGQHLVVIAAQGFQGSPVAPQIEFVLNWTDELKNRVAVR
jgi:serine/threonine-protein kinase